MAVPSEQAIDREVAATGLARLQALRRIQARALILRRDPQLRAGGALLGRAG